MKKFWKAKYINNSDFRLILKKLGFNTTLINIYAEENSYVYLYLKTNNYILLSIDDSESSYDHGWNELNDFDWYINNGYKYCGMIHTRKEKLEKINNKYCKHEKF